jgi:hypothetical protein
MVLKHVFAAAVVVTLLAWNGAAVAAGPGEYQPDEFLGLDLPTAVLSPKPLGPATQFAPVRIEAKSDPTSPAAAPARVTPKAVSQAGAKADAPKAAAPKAKIARSVVKKPRGVARTKLVRRHGNPLDAQAFDTRIQVWPCRSGGICNWQQR